MARQLRDYQFAISDDDLMIQNPDEAASVAQALANVLGIERNSLCFCGSGQKWKSCCGAGAGRHPIFTAKALQTARAYKRSKGQIEFIPVGIWKQFERASYDRLRCLYPGCTDRPVSCHLIPENILRTCFGGHCKEYRMVDASGLRFVKRGVGEAGCLPVFCSKHDNELFKSIDQIGTGPGSEEHSFLHALKSTAFSLRKTQGLLGIDGQVEIARPFLLQESASPPPGTHFTIDISNLKAQYIRYQTCFQFYKDALNAYAAHNWRYYSSLHRTIQVQRPIFFSGLINPSHDLLRQRINNGADAAVMSCTVFAARDRAHVVLSCPDGPSRQGYATLFRQLETVDDQTFKIVLNSFLTISAETLLMPESFELSEAELATLQEANQLATRALRGDMVLDLQDSDFAVHFI